MEQQRASRIIWSRWWLEFAYEQFIIVERCFQRLSYQTKLLVKLTILYYSWEVLLNRWHLQLFQQKIHHTIPTTNLISHSFLALVSFRKSLGQQHKNNVKTHLQAPFYFLESFQYRFYTFSFYYTDHFIIALKNKIYYKSFNLLVILC